MVEESTEGKLVSGLRELAPWHLDFEVAPGVSTGLGNGSNSEAPDADTDVSVVKPASIHPVFRRLYPETLAGKSFLDVGCNGGGYCFLAKRLGAATTMGFDPREHWIRQAEYVREHWHWDTTGMSFKVARLEEVDTSKGFDITLFKGVFYHLPNPIGNLLTLCEATREVIIVNCASRDDIPEAAMLSSFESTTHLMSGVDGLCWIPGGPRAVINILNSAGFGLTRVVFWKSGDNGSKPGRGRFEVVAARAPVGDLLVTEDDYRRTTDQGP